MTNISRFGAWVPQIMYNMYPRPIDGMKAVVTEC